MLERRELLRLAVRKGDDDDLNSCCSILRFAVLAEKFAASPFVFCESLFDFEDGGGKTAGISNVNGDDDLFTLGLFQGFLVPC